MNWIKKRWMMFTGGITGGLGFLGLGVCCIPAVGGLTSVLGVSVLFFHQLSQWLIGIGLVLLCLGILIVLKKNKRCCK